MGLFRGFAAFFLGVGFVVGTPRVWPRAAVPVLMAVALWAALGALGVWGSLHLAHRMVASAFGAGALSVLFALPAVLLALVLALALAQPLSGWALDSIVREQRSALALPPLREGGRVRAALSSLGAGVAAFAVGVLLIGGLTVIGALVPAALPVTVPLKVVVGALLVAWNLVDYPLAIIGFGMRARVRWFARYAGSMLGFGLAAMAFVTVPAVGLLALPCGVAGAARLIRQSDG
jgi:CysZ protein